MKYEKFEELFESCELSEKIAMFNEYQAEKGGDDTIYDFDEDFFENFFSNPTDAARAVFFGNIQSWSDEYIKFDGYGNLKSFSDYDVEQEIDDYIEEIFDYPNIWEQYIEDDGEEEDDEDEYED